MSKIRDSIVIKGAKEHNLKNIDVEIPRNKLVVITGLSGSGKSSLAFDTIYAEGQRRYVESLSNYARQFLQQLQKPEVESIDYLPPAIAIDQKSTSRNPRSTVSTVTEIYDYLRLMFAHIGVPHCPKCGKKVKKQSASQIINAVLSKAAGKKILILAPVIREKKGEYKHIFETIRKEGFSRSRVDGQIVHVEDSIDLKKYVKHTIEIVVDRITVSTEHKKRLAGSIETALQHGKGLSTIVFPDHEETFSEHYACTDCGINIAEITPRMFSFNAPYGACPECNGLGAKLEFSPDLIFINKHLPIRHSTSKMINLNDTYYGMMLESVGKKYGFDLDTIVNELNEDQWNVMLYGTGNESVSMTWEMGKNKNTGFSGNLQFNRAYEGVINSLKRRYLQTTSEHMRSNMRRYMAEETCHTCHGARLKPEVLAVKIHGLNISDITHMSIEQLSTFFDDLKLSAHDEHIAHELIKKIRSKLFFLKNVGIGYLTLDRKAGSLSGGEAQRIRLATQIGTGLIGVVYVLDEPSIGLHQRDNQKLINTLRQLRDVGNTVIVVEHDEETIRCADHVIDMGPKAGKHGGEIIYAGDLKGLLKHPDSITAKYLNNEYSAILNGKKRLENKKFIEIKKAAQNNLKEVDVKIPLSKFVCITGVSGSGKSSLINEVFYKAVAQRLYKSVDHPGKHEEITGLENIDKVIRVNQDPIGKTPRSNPATYTGVFTHIRDLFAATKDSAMRGYKAGRFSFNVKGGRCETCQGDGLKKIEMAFLPDVYVPCEVCTGKRYSAETLEITFKGKNIAEVLDMDVEQAHNFFHNIPKIKRILKTLLDVGLGYIHLGQSSTTLSGGEAQRIKLASELCKRSTGKTIYLLDEPTTGLHFADVEMLIKVLNRLVTKGNTVIVIEHNLDVIKSADHIIDLGPEGGDQGGYVVAQGTIEEVKKSKNSYTAQYL